LDFLLATLLCGHSPAALTLKKAKPPVGIQISDIHGSSGLPDRNTAAATNHSRDVHVTAMLHAHVVPGGGIVRDTQIDEVRADQHGCHSLLRGPSACPAMPQRLNLRFRADQVGLNVE